jgi:hypothetical protein
MASRRVLISFSVVSALVSGCDDSREAQLDIARFSRQMAETVCSALVECSCADRSEYADCTSALGMVFTDDHLSHYSPGRKLDPAAAGHCLARLRSSMDGCPGPTPGQEGWPSECWIENLLVGTQEYGEPCANNRDCAPGGYCDETDPYAPVCAAAPGPGEDCGSTWYLCAEGSYCSYRLGFQCERAPGPGESCFVDETHDGDADDVVDPCPGGTTCAGAGEGARCVPPHGLGEECTDGAGCAAGLHCDPDPGEAPATCVVQVEDGGECSSHSECLHGHCAVEGRCVALNFCADWMWGR